MGFYAPAQIVRDAREHGVVVRPPCINASHWDNVMEPDGRGGLALRLGFRQIKGMAEEEAQWIVAARGNGYAAVEDVWRRAGLGARMLARLAEADCFAALGVTRREALWAAKAMVEGSSPCRCLQAIWMARGSWSRRGVARDDDGRAGGGGLRVAAPDAEGASDGAAATMADAGSGLKRCGGRGRLAVSIAGGAHDTGAVGDRDGAGYPGFRPDGVLRGGLRDDEALSPGGEPAVPVGPCGAGGGGDHA
jgi:hypothetical protein